VYGKILIPSSWFFSPLRRQKKFGKHVSKFFLVQTSIKFTLKKVRKIFPEFFQGGNFFLRGGMRSFQIYAAVRANGNLDPTKIE
jgi:hypothetical protein